MIYLADVLSFDYGQTTYTVVLNDEEFNLLVLLLGTLDAREIFADYASNPDECDAIYSDALTGLMDGI